MPAVAVIDSDGLVVKRWHENQVPDREEVRDEVQKIIDRGKELEK